MEDFGLFVIGLILTLFFASLTGFFWWKSRHLKDLRTLKLGRFGLLIIFGTWITLNGLVGTALTLRPTVFQAGYLFLGIEVMILLVMPVLLGMIVPVAIVILTVKIWRRESRSFSNLLLPIIMLLFLLIDVIIFLIGDLPKSWVWLRFLTSAYPVLSVYIAWQFGTFFLSSWIYGRRVRKISAKYFVVLGAGLVNGEKVGRLLGNRIRSAVTKAKEDTVIIFSGGQGPDEKISEALAMQKYAVEELNFPIERTLLEENSRTTYENLVYSSQLIKEKAEHKEEEKFMFFSSDYHVFRAALFAAQLQLNAQGGKGGKTAMYYRVPAFIREFIAVLNMNKKKHLIIVGAIVAFYLLLAAFQQYLYNIGN